jgi:hypothetical protein
VTFEPSCELSRIEEGAYSYCLSMSSISIPSSVEMLCKRCVPGCESCEIGIRIGMA